MPLGLQKIDVGTIAGDKTGTPGRDAFIIINDNVDLVEAAMEDAERKAFIVSLGSGIVAAGTDIESFPMPYAFVLLEVRASVKEEQSGDDIQFDIKENGVSILDSILLTIPAGSKNSQGYSPAPDVEYIILEDWSEVSFDIVDGNELIILR